MLTISSPGGWLPDAQLERNSKGNDPPYMPLLAEYGRFASLVMYVPLSSRYRFPSRLDWGNFAHPCIQFDRMLLP